jgi:Asp-tRNA(Asn)/Glu-tRNA(Gln) amidotransferase C subunit
MTPEMRELHVRVGRLRRHDVVAVNCRQMAALAQAAHDAAKGQCEPYVNVEAGEIIQLLNRLAMAEIEDVRPRAVHVMDSPDRTDEKAPEPLTAATAR